MSEAKASDYKLIVRPIVTEKTSMVGGSGDTVVFEVERRASKTDIKEAIERAFKVEVKKVNTINYIGKTKRVGRSIGRTKSFKKAFVQLKPGFSIDVVEGV